MKPSDVQAVMDEVARMRKAGTVFAKVIPVHVHPFVAINQAIVTGAGIFCHSEEDAAAIRARLHAI